MTDLNELWANIDAYQAKADAAGHGESWLRMRQERTAEAAEAAWRAARNAVWVATGAVVMVECVASEIGRNMK